MAAAPLRRLVAVAVFAAVATTASSTRVSSRAGGDGGAAAAVEAPAAAVEAPAEAPAGAVEAPAAAVTAPAAAEAAEAEVGAEAGAVDADSRCDFQTVSSQLSRLRGRNVWFLLDLRGAFREMRDLGRKSAKVLGERAIGTEWLLARSHDIQSIAFGLSKNWDQWRAFATNHSLQELYQCTEHIASIWSSLHVQERWETMSANSTRRLVKRYCAAELAWSLMEVDPELRKSHGEELETFQKLPEQICVPAADAGAALGAEDAALDGSIGALALPPAHAADLPLAEVCNLQTARHHLSQMLGSSAAKRGAGEDEGDKPVHLLMSILDEMHQLGQRVARRLSDRRLMGVRWIRGRGMTVRKISLGLTKIWDEWRRLAVEHNLGRIYSCTERLAGAWGGLHAQERWETVLRTKCTVVKKYCAAELAWGLMVIDPGLRRSHGLELDALRVLPKQVCAPMAEASAEALRLHFGSDSSELGFEQQVSMLLIEERCDLRTVRARAASLQQKCVDCGSTGEALRRLAGVAEKVSDFGRRLAKELCRGDAVRTHWLEGQAGLIQQISDTFCGISDGWDTALFESRDMTELSKLRVCSERIAGMWASLQMPERWSMVKNAPRTLATRYCTAQVAWGLMEIDPDLRLTHCMRLHSLRSLPKQRCLPKAGELGGAVGNARNATREHGRCYEERDPQEPVPEAGAEAPAAAATGAAVEAAVGAGAPGGHEIAGGPGAVDPASRDAPPPAAAGEDGVSQTPPPARTGEEAEVPSPTASASQDGGVPPPASVGEGVSVPPKRGSAGESAEAPSSGASGVEEVSAAPAGAGEDLEALEVSPAPSGASAREDAEAPAPASTGEDVEVPPSSPVAAGKVLPSPTPLDARDLGVANPGGEGG